MSNIPFYTDRIPNITAEQMIEVDRLMIEEYKIELIQMMENAGRSLAHLARSRFLDGNPAGKRVIVMAGTGGNGGGALVCARRLHNYGANVAVFVTKPKDHFTPIPKHQFEILNRLNILIQYQYKTDIAYKIDLIIDGIIGYSLKGAPRGQAAEMIRWANVQDTPILSLDVPSGIDTTTGTVYEPAIQATATMTLALPKAGLRQPTVADYVGELYLADISVPRELYQSPTLDLDVPSVFAESDIVRLK